MPIDVAIASRTAADGAAAGNGWLGWLRGALTGAFATPVTSPNGDENEQQPWLVPAAIPFIEARLHPGMAALEWGSGRSTLWLAMLGLSVVSIEAREAWIAEARARIAAAALSHRVRFVGVERGQHPSLAQACADAAQGFGAHAFDLLLVDGPFKAACLRRAGAALKPGGILVLDDSHAADVAHLADQLAPWRLAAFDNGIWQTAVFQAPAEGLPQLHAVA